MHERVATALGELAREDVGGSGRDDFGHWVKTDSECKLHIHTSRHPSAFYYNIVPQQEMNQSSAQTSAL